MTDINETIRLAVEGAEELQIISVVNKNPALMKSVVAIRALIAKASETCEWKNLARKQNGILEELSHETKCRCDSAFTGRGKHEPNSLCHLHAEVMDAIKTFNKLVESKQEQGKKERTCQ